MKSTFRFALAVLFAAALFVTAARAGDQNATVGGQQPQQNISPAEALAYIQEKAAAGEKPAMLTMGTMYERGVGVPRNFAKALEWYRKCAAAGMSEGYYNVGVCYEIGMGTTGNEVEAFNNFEKSAELGLPQGFYKLATMYIQGVGTAKNEAWGIELLGRAAAGGHAGAANDLGLIAFEGSYGQKKDPTKAFEWFTQSANDGNAEAMKNLAVFYRDGIGRAKNPSEELKWYALARLAGYPAPPLNNAMEKVKSGMSEDQVNAVESQARAWLEDFQRRMQAKQAEQQTQTN